MQLTKYNNNYLTKSMKQKTAKTVFTVALLSSLFLLPVCGQYSTPQKNSQVKGNSRTNLFIENKGQWGSKALFLIQEQGLDMWVTSKGMVYDVYGISNSNGKIKRTGDVVEMNFSGSNEPRVKTLTQKDFKFNYFIGNNQTNYIKDVKVFEEVQLQNMYEKISSRYYRENGKVRYDIILDPGADPSKIRMSFKGNEKIGLLNDKLNVITKHGVISQDGLFAYQVIDGLNQKVNCKYKINNDGSIGFNISNYNQNLPVIIDPLVSSSYIGGVGNDFANSIATDGNYNTYVCGTTYSPSFPVTSGSYDQTKDNNYDVFVSKFNSIDDNLIYSTFIGGNSSESGLGIAIDNNGDAFVTGNTSSNNFPVSLTAYDKTQNGGSDAFIAKLNPNGNELLYSSYIGGAKNDEGTSISIDKNNCPYVAGKTESIDFPTLNGYDNSFNSGGDDGFISKFSNTGNNLIYSSYLGGSDRDVISSIKLFGNEAIVTGYTYSTNFPVSSTSYDQTSNGYSDGFITKLNAAGNNIIYSTLFGGEGYDESKSLVLDGNGSAIVCGRTSSSNFPTTAGAFDNSLNGAEDAFILRINANGTSLIYSTFIGGLKDEVANGVNLDQNGNVYIVGQTNSVNFPTTPDSYLSTIQGGTDGFIIKLDSNATALKYGTYFGGTKEDVMTSIALTNCGIPKVIGFTTSDNFPTSLNGYDLTFNGEYDAFISTVNLSSLKLLTPQPGEHLCTNSFYEIKWKSSNVSFVKIELSTDEGRTFTSVISPSTAGDDGVFKWNIPISQSGGNNFRIRISDLCGSNLRDTSIANIFIDAPIKVVASPLGRNSCQGETIKLLVRATGIDLKYQWRRNGVNIDGATDSVFQIKNASISDEGKYDVIVINNCGTDTSKVAIIGVMVTPVITNILKDDKVCLGQPMSLNISTSGSGLSYQWRKNGVLISGATDSVYIIKSVKLNDAGKYDVIVGNGCGSSVTSNIANIITGNAKVDAPSLMDFGKVSIDLKYRDVDVIVKNSNIEAIKFERIESLTEPFSVVLVSPQIPTMIAPNQILLLRVRYTSTGVSGNFNDTLKVHTSLPCSGLINVPLKITVGDLIDTNGTQGVRLQMPKMTISVKQATPVGIPIVYASPSEKPEGATSLEMDIAFNPKVMMPSDLEIASTFKETSKPDSAIVHVKISPVPMTGTLGKINMYPLLTSDSSSMFKVVSYQWEGVNPVTTIIDGEIKLKDVCTHGGIRDVFIPDGVGPKLLKIAPNPAVHNLNIDFIPTESGETTISMYNLHGYEVDRVKDFVDMTNGSNTVRSVQFNVSNLSSGVYMIIARSRSGATRDMVTVVK